MLLVASNVFMAILFGVIWGVANGIERIGLKVIWPNYFGRKYTGSISGVGSTVAVLGSAFGPLPFGIGYDLFNNYKIVITVTLVFPIIGVFCSLLATKPSKAQLHT